MLHMYMCGCQRMLTVNCTVMGKMVESRIPLFVTFLTTFAISGLKHFEITMGCREMICIVFGSLYFLKIVCINMFEKGGLKCPSFTVASMHISQSYTLLIWTRLGSY